MIEGIGLPDTGARLVLKRGDLQIGATVAWPPAIAAHPVRRAYLRPGLDRRQARPIDCTGLRDQRRVDAIQAAVRGGLSLVGATPTTVASETAEASSQHLGARLAEELAYVQRLLESMGDQLIANPLIVQRHARTLQSFDLANQILGHVAAIMVAEDRPARSSAQAWKTYAPA